MNDDTAPIQNLGQRCRICDSIFTVQIQDIVGQRSGDWLRQIFCMDCRSFFHDSNYSEDDGQQLADFEALIRDLDNHLAVQSQLALELKTRVPSASSVLEIGHGTGCFLRACENFGMSAHGLEVNPYCHAWATDFVGVSSELALLNETDDQTFDLIVAIHVFEHLYDPRKLFKDMISRVNADGAIYVSVPFILREQWSYLLSAQTTPQPTLPDPFFDNDVHITHFSVEGLERMGLSLGARSAEYFVSRDTYYQSPGSYHGILFRT